MLAFVVICVPNNGHSVWGEVESLSSFSWHFPGS